MKFPIKTISDQNQPRLLLVSVDVLEGAVVTFDSYPKLDGIRKSEYGDYIKLKENGSKDSKYRWHTNLKYHMKTVLYQIML